MLEGFGYQVVVAGTGEQAMEICNSDPEIDLILMDIDLGAGRLSGPEAATRILKAHHVPVLFLSSRAEPEMVARTENISTYGCVVKSTDGTVLDASIKMALRLFQANARLEAEREHLQATLNSIGDAVIATDVAGLITRMNLTVDRLTGFPLADALGRPLTEVFRIINAQTRVPSVDPVQAVLAHGEVVGLLLERGVAIDMPYENRLTALMWAAGQGSVATTRLLLDRGARTDLRDDRGLTAAEIARQAGHPAVLALFDGRRD